MRLIVLRHGATAWNAEGRLQGQADPPLGAAGRQALLALALPPEWRRLPCWVSPLARARETATLLGWPDPVVVPALIEMDWGRFEGRRLVDLRAELGCELARNEACGLDFRPPGGESPREVMARLQLWLDGLDNDDGAAILVTHKGIRRALLALATGWTMDGSPPVKLRDHDALLLRLAPDGELMVLGTEALDGPP
jgi:broad specificity phosphatase PhoE